MISFLCNRLAEFIIAKKIKLQSDEKIVEVFMETFIFNCYKKWLKERNGSFFKRLFGLTILAKILLLLLLISLIGFFVVAWLVSDEKIDGKWLFAPTVMELLSCAAMYIYNNLYEVSNSYKEFDKYKSYCMDLSFMLSTYHISNEIIIEIIERYKKTIDNMNNNMMQNYERINKVMQMLLLPISLAILGALFKLDMKEESILGYGVTFFLIIAFVYGVACFVAFICNEITKSKQDTYKLFVNDLQSIIDLEKCNSASDSVVTVETVN